MPAGFKAVIDCIALALLSSKGVGNAQPKVYEGVPHGLCSTHKNQVNADLLALIGA